MSGNFSFVINVACLTTSTYGYITGTNLPLPPVLKKAGHKQFFTNISLVVTMINNVANILNYLIQKSVGIDKKRKNKPFIANLSEIVSRHLTLPLALVLETVVPLVYWPLRIFFANLILTLDTDQPDRPLIPLSIDLAIHFFPFVFLITDHYYSGSGLKFRLSNKTVWFIVVAIAVGYYKFLQALIDPNEGQAYPYPFLDVPEPYKTIIFVITGTVAWWFYTVYQRFPPKSLIDETFKLD
ncbi:hypothetical protein RNJ44_02323 [Nakaseomyces bracarensis]|uniref:Uncharacterized protein n=1 Tax=Nakaseomyces bracarensis TaxID=273131 RepID=A0ABR4NN57_9SACH